MIEFLHSLHTFELACMTVLLGVMINAIILRACGINPGGILGTSFLLLAASDSVLWALVLLAIAPLISWVYGMFLSRVYRGREPAFLMAAMSVLLASAAGLIMQHFNLMPTNSNSFPLGIILPAIIATAIRKQGLIRTYSYMALATVITIESLVIIIDTGMWLGYDFLAFEQLAGTRQSLQMNWISPFALISIVIGYLMYRMQEVQAAGYIVLPLLATLAIVSPVNFLLLLVTAAIAFFVTSMLRRYSLVIGTSRYALASTISVTLVWTITYLLLHQTGDFSPYMGTGLFAVLSVSVLVNEHTLYGAGRAFPIFAVSLALMAIIEVSSSMLIGSARHQQPSNLQFYVIKQPTGQQ